MVETVEAAEIMAAMTIMAMTAAAEDDRMIEL